MLSRRFFEIDGARGIALLLMLISNTLTDLQFFRVSFPFSDSVFWFWFARLVASAFVFLAGLSLYLKYQKEIQSRRNTGLKKVFFFRAIKIFGWGLAITAVTWFFLRQGFVAFGVLHLIGIATILALPFLRLPQTSLFFGLAFIAIGIFLQNMSFDFSWLLWLGFLPKGYYSVDYFPIFPWFGIILLGIFFASIYYKKAIRRFELRDYSGSAIEKFFCFLGRNSLKIYLLHQPIILIAMQLLGIIKIF